MKVNLRLISLSFLVVLMLVPIGLYSPYQIQNMEDLRTEIDPANEEVHQVSHHIRLQRDMVELYIQVENRSESAALFDELNTLQDNINDSLEKLNIMFDNSSSRDTKAESLLQDIETDYYKVWSLIEQTINAYNHTFDHQDQIDENYSRKWQLSGALSDSRNYIRNNYVWNDSYHTRFHINKNFTVEHPDYPSMDNVSGQFLFERLTYYEKEYLWQYWEIEADPQGPNYQKHYNYFLLSVDDFTSFIDNLFSEGEIDTIVRDDINNRWKASYLPLANDLFDVNEDIRGLEERLASERSDIRTNFTSSLLHAETNGHLNELINIMGQRVENALLDSTSSSINYVWVVLLMVAFIVLLSVGLGTYNSRKITKPLYDMQNASKRVEQGDLSVNLKPDGDDEIRELATSFNNMVVGLRKTEGLIKEKARDEIIGIFVSALPVFASNIPPNVRHAIIFSFGERFEKNMKEKYDEMGLTDPGERIYTDPNGAKVFDSFDKYLRWLTNLYRNLGSKTSFDINDGHPILKVHECPWETAASENATFCLMCRTMAIRSYKWTRLPGSPSLTSTIANGDGICSISIPVDIPSSQ